MPYTPHTPEDIRRMLETVGISEVDQLFSEIDSSLLSPEITVPAPLSEWEVEAEIDRLGGLNKTTRDHLSFLGAGAYERVTPSLIHHLTSRAEFSTSYTPYQAEVSQGTLQFVFEFQSLIAALTGLEAANASMYDGASALAEAALMALRVTHQKKIFYAATLHPRWKQTLRTYLGGTGAELLEVPEREGILDTEFLHRSLDEDSAAFLVQHPNFFGYLEDVEALAGIAERTSALWVQASDPVSLGLLSPPGDVGADIAVGELQSLGLPLSFGGPYAGYFACKQKFVRQMPGRIVGRTRDVEGKTGYVLTLQTREQHIRRDKATSNICTNQSLCALGSTIYLALMGSEGLREVAQQNYDKAHYLAAGLQEIEGVSLSSGRPFFNEFTLVLPKPATEVAAALKSKGILAGLHHPRWTGDDRRLVMCVTETKRKCDLDRAAEAFREVLGG